MTKFDETIQEMEDDVKNLEDEVKSSVEELNIVDKEKATALVEKTKAAINATIEKVKDIIDDVKDDDKLDDFLDKVKAKSKEAVDFTKEKINELKRVENEPKYDLGKIADEITGEFDKIKETEAFKKTTDFLKEIGNNINDFFEKPEVKDTITKVKVGAVDIAEKGVEGLKKILKTDGIAPETAKEEAPVEEAPAPEAEKPEE